TKERFPEVVTLAFGDNECHRVSGPSGIVARHKLRRILLERYDLVFIAVDEERRHFGIREHSHSLDGIILTERRFELVRLEAIRGRRFRKPRIGAQVEHGINAGDPRYLVRMVAGPTGDPQAAAAAPEETRLIR